MVPLLVLLVMVLWLLLLFVDIVGGAVATGSVSHVGSLQESSNRAPQRRAGMCQKTLHDDDSIDKSKQTQARKNTCHVSTTVRSPPRALHTVRYQRKKNTAQKTDVPYASRHRLGRHHTSMATAAVRESTTTEGKRQGPSYKSYFPPTNLHARPRIDQGHMGKTGGVVPLAVQLGLLRDRRLLGGGLCTRGRGNATAKMTGGGGGGEREQRWRKAGSRTA